MLTSCDDQSGVLNFGAQPMQLGQRDPIFLLRNRELNSGAYVEPIKKEREFVYHVFLPIGGSSVVLKRQAAMIPQL